MSNLSKKVQNFAHQNNLLWKNQGILIGISGGADSVCLLNVLFELSKKYHFRLHLAHINYNLRGKESFKDYEFVEDLAKKNNLGFSVLSLEKPKSYSNLEKELRDARYDFFEKERKRLKLDSIAIAHNQDDQAETVLFRTGLSGIASMKSKNGKIIRPLLDIPRKEIESYLKEKKLKFRKDKTNFEPIFTRNKIRLELIPYLEKKFNPSIKRNLSFLASSVGADYEYISSQVKFRAKSENGKISFSSAKIKRLHESLRREFLRRSLKEIKGNLLDVEFCHIEEIEKIMKSTKNKTQKVSFKGLKIEKKGDIISVLYSN